MNSPTVMLTPAAVGYLQAIFKRLIHDCLSARERDYRSPVRYWLGVRRVNDIWYYDNGAEMDLALFEFAGIAPQADCVFIDNTQALGLNWDTCTHTYYTLCQTDAAGTCTCVMSMDYMAVQFI